MNLHLSDFFQLNQDLYNFFKIMQIDKFYGGITLKKVITTRWEGHFLCLKVTSKNFHEICMHNIEEMPGCYVYWFRLPWQSKRLFGIPGAACQHFLCEFHFSKLPSKKSVFLSRRIGNFSSYNQWHWNMGHRVLNNIFGIISRIMS